MFGPTAVEENIVPLTLLVELREKMVEAGIATPVLEVGVPVEVDVPSVVVAVDAVDGVVVASEVVQATVEQSRNR